MLREYDLAGRFGGEEFVMLLPQTRAPDAFRIAERVRAHIARLPISAPGGERISVTVSIGVAALDAGSSRELTELLAAADAALYRAKASGRDQVQMISTSRGLSAVRPADDRDADAGGLWRGALRPAGGSWRAGSALDDSADSTTGLANADAGHTAGETSAEFSCRGRGRRRQRRAPRPPRRSRCDTPTRPRSAAPRASGRTGRSSRRP